MGAYSMDLTEKIVASVKKGVSPGAKLPIPLE